ncbi:MAG: putative endopeptidase [Thermomicrobiales bacterium]|nr:putative endopeptidase [Thermomicrobiales bacterium]
MRPSMRRWSLLSALTVALVALSSFAPVLAQQATPVASPVAQGTSAHGVDVANLDPSTDPGKDFYRYATGGWQDRTEIPADEASYGVSDEVDDLTIEQLLGLLDRLAGSAEVPVGSDEWKAVQLFRQAKDLKTRNAQGIAPIKGDFAAIAAIGSFDAFYTFLRDGYLTSSISGLYGVYADVDLADSSVYTAWYYGPFLGLPNRDYYWVDTPENEAIREAYLETCAKLLGFAGYDAARAEAAAKAVYALEKRLSEPVLRPEDYNDPGNYYHPRPVADLVKANPAFDWSGFLTLLGVPDLTTVVVTEEAYLKAVDDIVAHTDLETLKDYLALQVLWGNAGSLSEEIGATAFAFSGTTLYGVEEQPPIEEQALDAVNGSLGFALGKLYVDEYFPPEAKAQIEELVAHLIEASRNRVNALTWMSPETKKTAIAKLDALRAKVGYPDTWRTYENVTIEESFAKTLFDAGLADYLWRLDRIGEPVDRNEWFILPQEVNAYYDPTKNEIVFPAAILQPPFFDYQADPASNYGSIGAVIGHEITHGFDQSGSQFDANGNLTDWWTAEDKSSFEALTVEVVSQYGAIEVLPGLNVDGELTIGENIADMGGLQIAYDALQATLKESGDPGPIDGLSQDQRFFIAFAFSWAEESRDEFLTTLVKTNEHAPSQVRGAQPERNMEEFFDAFDIEPGDPMYLTPEDRVVIW